MLHVDPPRPSSQGLAPWSPLDCIGGKFGSLNSIAALCRGGIENPELALELVCGADCWCNRHCKTSPVDLEGFWGQVCPKIGRKPTRKLRIENQQSAAVIVLPVPGQGFRPRFWAAFGHCEWSPVARAGASY